MKRKVYATRRERMIDQILGFVAFPLVNVPLGIILWLIGSEVDPRWLTPLSLLPWLVNGLVLVPAFLWRPEFAIGYITFIGVVVALALGLSAVVVAACFVIIPLYLVIGEQVNWVFVILIGIGLFGIIMVAISLIKSWLSSSKNKPQ